MQLCNQTRLAAAPSRIKGRAAAYAKSPRATRVTFTFGAITEQTQIRQNTAPVFFFKKPGTE